MQNYRIKEVILSILLLFVLSSCKTVDQPNVGPPGSRNYTWTVDTLKVDGGFMSANIWGAASNDVWLDGGGSSEDLCLWHYDGKTWKTVNALPSSNLNALSGLDSDFIWIGDSDGSIFRYNGKNWYLFQKIHVVGFDNWETVNFYFNSKDDGYCVGQKYINSGGRYEGDILKFNGSQWFPLNMGDYKCAFTIIKKHKASGLYLVLAEKPDCADWNKIYIFDSYDRSLHEIYSGTHTPSISEINNELYISIDRAIYKLGKNGSLQLWKSFKWSTPYSCQANGMAENDFFAIGALGLMHYNGTDLVTVYKTDLMLFNMLVFEDAVFVCAIDNLTNRTVIIKGLKINNTDK